MMITKCEHGLTEKMRPQQCRFAATHCLNVQQHRHIFRWTYRKSQTAYATHSVNSGWTQIQHNTASQYWNT